MIYHCEQCKTVLRPGEIVCTICGKIFSNPVPADAEVPAPVVSSIPLNGPPVNGRGGGRLVLGICVAAVVILIIVIWGGKVLWMRGLGGDIAYARYNTEGNHAADRGDFRTANYYYSKMIALEPDRDDGYLLRGINDDQAGWYDQAVHDDTKGLAIAREPMMRGDFFYNRANAWGSEGVWARAIADYTQAGREYALERSPDLLSYVPNRQENVVRSLGDANWHQQNYAVAIADLTRLIEHYHVRPYDYGIRGKCEAALKHDAAAQADFNHALSMNPSYFPGYTGLAAIDTQSDHYTQAVAVYQRAVRANPYNADCWGNLAWFQYEAGEIPAAIATNRKAQLINPNEDYINYNMALCYAVLGDGTKATSEYARTLADSSAAARAGALTDLHNALAQHPHSPTVRLALAQVERGPVDRGSHASFPIPAPPFLPPAPPVSPAFENLLAKNMAVDGFAIRPPKGYTLQNTRQVYLNGAGWTALWEAPRRADGTVPDLQVIISTDNGRMASEHTSAQEEQLYLQDLGENHTDLTTASITPCLIGNRKFVQSSWSGTGQLTGKKYSGAVFISVTPGQYIEISTHDAAPYNKSTLPLLNASALTFQKL